MIHRDGQEHSCRWQAYKGVRLSVLRLLGARGCSNTSLTLRSPGLRSEIRPSGSYLTESGEVAGIDDAVVIGPGHLSASEVMNEAMSSLSRHRAMTMMSAAATSTTSSGDFVVAHRLRFTPDRVRRPHAQMCPRYRNTEGTTSQHRLVRPA